MSMLGHVVVLVRAEFTGSWTRLAALAGWVERLPPVKHNDRPIHKRSDLRRDDYSGLPQGIRTSVPGPLRTALSCAEPRDGGEVAVRYGLCVALSLFLVNRGIAQGKLVGSRTSARSGSVLVFVDQSAEDVFDEPRHRSAVVEAAQFIQMLTLVEAESEIRAVVRSSSLK
jgi:hypothetical protein